MRRNLMFVFVWLLLPVSAQGQAPAGGAVPTVAELIAKNVEARGGESRLSAITTRRVTGTITLQGMDARMEVLAKRPNLMLQEMLAGEQRFVTAYDGQQAWALNPMLGDAPQRVEGPQADALRDQAQFDGLLVGAHKRGEAIEVLGREVVDGTPTWKLAIKRDNRVTNVFLDEKTALERKVSATIAGDAGDVLIESVISDYQPIDGAMVPRKVVTRVGGQLQASVSIESVEFNVPIDDSRFKMPGSAEAPPPPQ
jgi:outer membrane lipoprotein-sorting protein